jgi:hypothetical protein
MVAVRLMQERLTGMASAAAETKYRTALGIV